MDEIGPVEAGVRKTVDRLPVEMRDRGHAALAIALAKRLDTGMSDTPFSMNARALENVLEKLEKVAPAMPEKDGLDDLQERRALRRAAAAARQSGS